MPYDIRKFVIFSPLPFCEKKFPIIYGYFSDAKTNMRLKLYKEKALWSVTSTL